MPNPEPGISVIICCYNSSSRLTATLQHLAQQQIEEGLSWEIIVVDNASTDSTTDDALSIWLKYNTPEIQFSIISEEKPGLAFARHAGVNAAKFKYIIFCDDDNWLDPDYVSKAYSMIARNTDIGAVGGFSKMATDSNIIPVWFENFQSRYAVGPQAKVQGDVSTLGPIWGAGMVTKKELFLNCNPENFPVLLSDRKKGKLSAGGDTEFCLRLLLTGYKLYYNPNLQLTHFIPKARLTLRYKERIEAEGIDGSKEMVKYLQLYSFVSASNIQKPWIVLKTFLGFLSAVILKRKSWAFQDVLRIFYYATNIDLGMDHNTKQIYQFYKRHNFNLTSPS